MSLKFILPCIFTLLCLRPAAQLPVRTVVDSATRKPLPYATIKVMHSPRGVIASENGTFRLEIHPSDTVMITSLGYRAAMLTGHLLTDSIFLVPNPVVLENVTIHTYRLAQSYVVGNGAGLLDKHIKCNDQQDRDGDCLPWSYGAGAEFAEPIFLPDTNRTFRINEVYIPMAPGRCWQPVFLQVYEATAAGTPGNPLFRKYIILTQDHFKKGKARIDLSGENILLAGAHTFFIGLSWTTEIPEDGCLTVLLLLRSKKGNPSYSRNLQSPEYNWFRFNGNRPGRESKEPFHTMLAVKLQAVEK